MSQDDRASGGGGLFPSCGRRRSGGRRTTSTSEVSEVGSSSAKVRFSGGSDNSLDGDGRSKVKRRFFHIFECVCEFAFSFKVVVGICAMAKKSLSKPMQEILTRLREFEYISTLIFPEEVILNVRYICLETIVF